MKSPNPFFGQRNPSNAARSTPDRFSHSPSSSYSDASTVRNKSNKNPVALAARSVAGVFVSCFTPPESEKSTSFGDSEEFKAPSVFSDTSRASSERRRSSNLNTSRAGSERRSSNSGVYASSSHNSSSQSREPGNVNIPFTMGEIYKATRNFSPSFKIGQGGFGTVYKGRLEDGTTVAIKRAKKSLYDKHLGVEFQSEIKTLAQVEHLNLVKYYGCLEYQEERIVVVEYVPNGTLREHLDCLHGNILDLAARLDIAIDVAHAVTYLHMYTVQAMKKFNDGDAISTLDPRLEQSAANHLALEKVLELALQCLAPHRQNRPSMRRCAEILWSIRKDYREIADMRSLASHSQRIT
ncbi:hypothetical protein EZV62_009902 [Acer yangbiense]|uniref:Protein kinase domain-containing protein n=1 Tax=Acer yangbiense TaxID=1000413 RepID=A0A5C7I1S7_9ROSI|nr:hypothetical protein EZV62_009902 [Acer yangbiense]